MLTTFDDEEYVVRALRAGASGYLLKDLPAAELAEAVRLAHAGVGPVRPGGVRPAGGRPAPPAAGPGRAAAAGGPRRPDPARGRGAAPGRRAAPPTGRSPRGSCLSEGTVKNHVSRILTRLGLRDRTQAAIYARDRGLL